MPYTHPFVKKHVNQKVLLRALHIYICVFCVLCTHPFVKKHVNQKLLLCALHIHISLCVLQHILGILQDVAFFDTVRVGELLNRLSTDTEVIQGVVTSNLVGWFIPSVQVSPMHLNLARPNKEHFAIDWITWPPRN